jgi:hypothetical protein
VSPGKNVNVVVVAYVTAQAGLKLYEYVGSWIGVSFTVRLPYLHPETR